MSYLSDLLGDAYKEGMTEEEISTAYLDVHTVGLQFSIGTFGHGDTHQV